VRGVPAQENVDHIHRCVALPYSVRFAKRYPQNWLVQHSPFWSLFSIRHLSLHLADKICICLVLDSFFSLFAPHREPAKQGARLHYRECGCARSSQPKGVYKVFHFALFANYVYLNGLAVVIDIICAMWEFVSYTQLNV
jgi:hypothetical protein